MKPRETKVPRCTSRRLEEDILLQRQPIRTDVQACPNRHRWIRASTKRSDTWFGLGQGTRRQGDRCHRHGYLPHGAICDLIVIASHGRRGMMRLLLGSLAQKVVTLSKLPVLICR